MMISHAMKALEDKDYSSIKGLRMFLMFHRVFLFLLDHHPNVKQEIETKIADFIQSEEKRHKNFTPDIGILMALLSVSERHSFESIKQPLLMESLDRKVLWTSKKVPQLLQIIENDFNQELSNQTFMVN